MTIIIELNEEEAAKLNRLAKERGTNAEDAVRSWLATVPPIHLLTARELLRLPKDERERYLRAAAEDAAPLYATDLALPSHERELTAISSVAGLDYNDASGEGYNR